MTAPSQIVVTALGMISSVGATAVDSAACVRAGLNRFREYEPWYPQREEGRENVPEPLIAALAVGSTPPIPVDDGSGPGPAAGVIDLFSAALQDLVRNSGLGRAELARLMLYAALPAAGLSSRNVELHRAFLQGFHARSGLQPFRDVRILAGGHPGALFALEDAARALAEGRLDAAIVAGADSYLDADTLCGLDAAERLKSKRNRDGFIPGEGAAAVLVERRADAERRGAPILAAIGVVGFGREPRAIGSGEPSSAEGLSAAVLGACGVAVTMGETPRPPAPPGDGPPLSWVLCDLNGESYRAKEWGHVRVRQAPILGSVRHVWHPADCLGDVGAATGAALVVLAARAFARGYAPARRALIFAGADAGTRAAVTLIKG